MFTALCFLTGVGIGVWIGLEARRFGPQHSPATDTPAVRPARDPKKVRWIIALSDVGTVAIRATDAAKADELSYEILQHHYTGLLTKRQVKQIQKARRSI